MTDAFSPGRCTFLEPLNAAQTVFLARDAVTGQLYTARQLTEAQTQPYRRLAEHPVPHTPRVRHLQQDAEGRYLVYCDYVAGATLESVLAERGTLPAAQAVALARQLCDTLAALDALALVHRDIKPANLLLTADGEPYLIDFDISRIEKPGQRQDTRILGTAGYAAPEQFGFGQTDSRADLYALGVLLNVMVTGALPGDCRADGALGDIIARCTRLDPADRYETPQALRAALDGLRLPEPASAPVFPAPGLGPTGGVRRRLLFWGPLALLAALLLPAVHSTGQALAVVFLLVTAAGWLLFGLDGFALRSHCRFVQARQGQRGYRLRVGLVLLGWALAVMFAVVGLGSLLGAV